MLRPVDHLPHDRGTAGALTAPRPEPADEGVGQLLTSAFIRETSTPLPRASARAKAQWAVRLHDACPGDGDDHLLFQVISAALHVADPRRLTSVDRRATKVRSQTPQSAVALGLSLELQTDLRSLPGLLQTLALLPVGGEALEVLAERAAAENPLLEFSPDRCRRCGRPGRRARCPCAGSRPAARSTESAVRPFETLATAVGCEVGDLGRAALPVVLDLLTDRGLLVESAGDIAVSHSLSVEAVLEAIEAVRAAGPIGICERTLGAQLATQAEHLVVNGEAPSWLPTLVRNHLPDLAEDRWSEICARLGQPEDDVRRAAALVRRRLRPLSGIRDVVTPPDHAVPIRVPPDIYMDLIDGVLSVEVPDSERLGLRLAELPDCDGDRDATEWVAGYRHGATTLLHQLDIRASALRRIALQIAGRQHGWLTEGTPLAGMTRQQVADSLGLHRSTVSRAVSGKYLRRPDGAVVELCTLFGPGDEIRSRLEQLIAQGITTDQNLAAALSAEGHRVARRTVAKYRAELCLAATSRGGRRSRVRPVADTD